MTPIGKWTWRGAARWVKSLVRSVWPFADSALELAKPAILKAFDSFVDGQQEKLKKALEKKGPREVSKVYDMMQRKLIAIVQKLSLVPQEWRDSACLIIEDEGNTFQRAFLPVLEARGIDGLNILIDDIQMEIRQRIKAL